MVVGFLYLNALLFAAFAAWCTLAPQRTAAAIGLQGLTAAGQSEYLTIYGGLQLGLGLFFFYLARTGEQRLGLLFALALYVPIVAFRLVTLVRLWPVGGTTLAVAGLEVALLLASAGLWFASPARA